jgi:hypothetical protein
VRINRPAFSANMKGRYLILAIAVTVLSGCAATPKVPGGQKENYPGLVKDSTDRRARAETEWRRMLEAYSVPQTPPDFYPITYTPRSLLGVSGGIKIAPQLKPSEDPEALALREVARNFIQRWHDLIGADPSGISLASAGLSEGLRRLVYRQANYPFAVVGNYGVMTISLSPDGRVAAFDDRFIPVVDLPVRPSIERDAAVTKLVGRTLSFVDSSGRQQSLAISDRAEVSVKQLVVLPIQKGDLLEVHLAWEMLAGKAESRTIFIDAVNGEELKSA